MALGTLLLSLPVVQTKIARYATDSLNEEFGTDIQIERVGLSLFTLETGIRGIHIADHHQDTLAHIDRLRTSILNLRNMVDGTLEFGKIRVDGVTFNLKTYAGEESTSLAVFVAKLDDGKPRDPEIG